MKTRPWVLAIILCAVVCIDDIILHNAGICGKGDVTSQPFSALHWWKREPTWLHPEELSFKTENYSLCRVNMVGTWKWNLQKSETRLTASVLINSVLLNLLCVLLNLLCVLLNLLSETRMTASVLIEFFSAFYAFFSTFYAFFWTFYLKQEWLLAS